MTLPDRNASPLHETADDAALSVRDLRPCFYTLAGDRLIAMLPEAGFPDVEPVAAATVPADGRHSYTKASIDSAPNPDEPGRRA